MKIKRQNRSILFRGMVLAFAFAMAILCAPVKEVIAWAASMAKYTDYSYMTIGKTDEQVSTTVIKGNKYEISNAYIGGGTYAVGKTAGETVLDSANGVVLKSSTVTVNYSTVDFDEISDSEVADGTDVTNKVVVTSENEKSYGYFVADKVGVYTVKYAYEYTKDDKTYTSSYELKVTSELSSATISFEDNDENFVPSIIDLALAKDGESYKNLNIPVPTLTDEDGKEIKDVKIVTSKNEVASTGYYVVVSVTGGNSGKAVSLTADADDNLYIAGSVFADANYGAGKYTIRYSYYVDGNFVTSTTKTTQVYGEDNKYYTDYSLKLELSSDWTDDGQTGVASTLPTAKGVTSKDSKPASESVDVYYTVKAYYKSTGSDKSWTAISAEDYNTEDETVVDENGNLADPTSFKPLKDGWYTFVYTIRDFYGNEVSSTKGVYDFENIKDEKAPTPVVYDASTDSEEDASYKLKTRAVPNSVVVYAIGIDDNVSKAGDENVVLTRKIMTDDTTVKLTITDYNNKNLVFNYRNASTTKAYQNLTANNYLIRKETTNISSDTDMLAWLAEHNYMIVVDNANAETIYNIFNAENYFATIESVNSAEGDEAKLTAAKEWFKTEEAKTAGFAYIDVDTTFGATGSDNGMGVGQYYIHYIAKDAAGNEKDVSKSMYIGSYTDNDSPTIKFSTTLADTYLPNATVTFDVPTATDNYDSNMIVKTMYRYLDKDGKVISVTRDNKEVSTGDLDDLWTDLENTDGVKDLTTTYKKYHDDTVGANDGYIDLTDTSASSYSIDVSEAGETAVTLQIVVFTYDDQGNPTLYGQTINISNTTDQYAPVLRDVATSDTFSATYYQGQEIELPTMTVADDAVAFMSYDVNVYYVKTSTTDGTKTTTRTKVSSYDSTSSRKILGQSGAGTFTVNAGKFVASFAGNYEVSIAVKDSKNNTIVSFINYEVKERTIIQDPVLSASIESKTIELGESVELPTPSVSYQIADSVTYDLYSEDATAYADTKYVVMGVNQNGTATDASITHGTVGGEFKPTAIGEYALQYSVDITVYNKDMFTYVEMGYNDGDYTGGYFTYENNSRTAQVTINNGVYTVVVPNEGSDGNIEYLTIKNVDGEVKVYDEGNNLVEEIDASSVLYGVDLEDWLDELKVYNLKSDTYTIIVEDTTGPVIKLNGEYPDAISSEDINTTDGYKLTVYGISSEEEIGDSSKVVISWKLANGDTGSYSFGKLINDSSYTIKANMGDGTYTVTYTVYDLNGNYTTESYSIAVGDNEAPVLTFDDNFVSDSYEIGSTLTIDTTKIHWTDNKGFADGVKPTIKLTNTSTSKEIEGTSVSDSIVYKMDTVGTYTLTVEIEDAAGNTTTKTFSIEVTTKDKDSTTTYQVVGTVLIVISVLVLAGVIVYFIVSKVKLDKELKK